MPRKRGVKQGETVHQAGWYVEGGWEPGEVLALYLYVHGLQHDIDSRPTSTPQMNTSTFTPGPQLLGCQGLLTETNPP